MKFFTLLFSTLIWLAAVSLGTEVLFVHDHIPGKNANAPGNWPAQSKIVRVPDQPTLIMFAHPHCACTRASIGELAVLMTHCQKRVNACVIFFQPHGCSEDWLHTDLWRSAKAIPGVIVRADEEGHEAGRFQATTSGVVVLYDIDGKLIFDGGITSARGHSGDNDGRSAIMKLLNNDMEAIATTPVFGCSLLNPKLECGGRGVACTN